MTRSVEEWVGKSDDTKVPPRVRARVFLDKKGLCHKCGRKILTGETWTCEHLIAIINGGQNREANLDLTCCNCLRAKNSEDMAIKSKVARVAKKHLGLSKSKNPLPGSKASPWRRRMDGTVERRT